jgi:hypothetical protein
LIAQIELQKSVVNAAGGTLENGSYKTSFSVGAPVNGVLQDAGNNFMTTIGFFPINFSESSGSTSETDITLFSFAEQTGTATINTSNHTVDIKVAIGTPLDALVATFDLSDNATTTVEGADQVSGVTANDFSSAVTYTVTAQDGVTSQDWTVTVGIDVNLIAYYPFNGDATDHSGNANHGTENGGMGYTTDRFGNSGSAASFDGDDDEVTVDLASPTSSLTFSAWINYKETALNDFHSILEFGDDSPFFGISGGQLMLFNAVQDDQQITLNSWIHVAATSTSGAAELYINGVNVASGTDTPVLTGTSLKIGGANGDVYFEGDLDEIRIYNRALSAAEMTDLYNAENGLNSETDITSFSFANQTDAATINASNHTVDIAVDSDTPLTNLIATYSLSAGATADVGGASQTSASTSNDFSSDVIYTVTAEDGLTTQDWTVTVTAGANTAPTITSFSPLSGSVGTVVTISGSNFSTTQSNNTVKFNGVTASVTASTASSITTSVPSGGETGKITVEVGGQSAESATDFTVNTASTTLSIDSESFVTSYDQGSTMTVSITINDANSASKINFISRGISEDVGDATSQELDSEDNVFEISLKATELNDPIGLTYYFEAVDNEPSPGIVTSSVGNAYVNFASGTSVPALPSLTFGAQATNYQIIAIPYELEDKKVTTVFSELGAYDKTLWRLFDYANGNNREYSGFSNIDIGKGYWFIARNRTTIDPGSGSTPAVTETNPFTISLRSGWNLIGNPYNFQISWDDVLTANGSPSGIGRLNTFSGGTLSESANLSKFRGGFVFNENASSVSVNIPVISSLGGRYEEEEIPADLGEVYWELALNLSQGDLHNKLGGIGMHPEATIEGKDAYDQVSVPLIDGMGFFELGFAHPEYSAKFSKEVVPTASQYTWEMTIKRDLESQPITLSWDNTQFGINSNQLYLFNPLTLEVINMKETSQIEIGSSTTSLQVLFGSQSYIDHQLEEATPLLGEPYPNPTAQLISYPFRIAKDDSQLVSLKIYDSTGKLVGEKKDDYSAGYYLLDWQFDRQGMYIMELQIGETTKRNKIIVR